MTNAAWRAEQPRVPGWYWFRASQDDRAPWVVKVQRLDMGMMQMWCIGCDRPVIIGDGGEFLGPLTPDSYQQGRVAGLTFAAEQAGKGAELWDAGMKPREAEALREFQRWLQGKAQQAQEAT